MWGDLLSKIVKITFYNVRLQREEFGDTIGTPQPGMCHTVTKITLPKMYFTFNWSTQDRECCTKPEGSATLRSPSINTTNTPRNTQYRDSPDSRTPSP